VPLEKLWGIQEICKGMVNITQDISNICAIPDHKLKARYDTP